MAKLVPHRLMDDEDRNRTIAWIHPASREAVTTVMDAPTDSDDGRSNWVWIRLPNGDLALGVFPQGDTYLEVEADAQYPGDKAFAPPVHRLKEVVMTHEHARALHWVLLEAVDTSLNRDLDPVDHGKEATDLVGLIDLLRLFDYDMSAQRDALVPIVNKGKEAAKSPMQKVRDLLDRVQQWDKTMGDPHGDGTGNEARPPTGDDYSDLYNDVVFTLKEVLKAEDK